MSQMAAPRACALLMTMMVSGLLADCSGGGDDEDDDYVPKTVVLDFGVSDAAWSGGWSDYSTANAPTDALTAFEPLPTGFDGQGFYLAGTNYSDDLWLYATGPVDGLAIERSYWVDILTF